VLPAEERLRRDRDFRRVYAAKRAIVHPLMVLYTRRYSGGTRIGFSVSKKLGGAVKRNRIKRRLREACKAQSFVLKSGFDAIIVARSRIGSASYSEIVGTVGELFRRAGIAGRAPEQNERDERPNGNVDPGIPMDGNGKP
jgi:ribonuclease P protein component